MLVDERKIRSQLQAIGDLIDIKLFAYDITNKPVSNYISTKTVLTCVLLVLRISYTNMHSGTIYMFDTVIFHSKIL